jgi:hypothetical protein
MPHPSSSMQDAGRCLQQQEQATVLVADDSSRSGGMISTTGIES